MTCVLGSGTWATAIVKILLEHKDETINWWIREPEIAEGIRKTHHNPCYLSEIELNANRLHISGDITEVIKKSDDIFIVIPSAYVAQAFEPVTAAMLARKRLHSAVKGLLPRHCQTVTDFLRNTYKIPVSRMSVVVGPSHAEETARQRLTYLTVASRNKNTAEHARKLLQCSFIKTEYSTDIFGIEYSAVLKNIYAIAIGICYGLGYGDNLAAVLACNCVEEGASYMRRRLPIGSKSSRPLVHTPYLGDFLVTAYSHFSRNRTFGVMIGRGYTPKAAQLEMKMVAEGYYATYSIEAISRLYSINLPIQHAVYQILYEKAPAAETMAHLLENLK
ncbi:MAG: glycerol-3-phosphate dehydrogenase [Bacteroidales bacterium]|nr:glycerol-3-phosphate dehydrogenase [Bacteroidales bacterium]